VAREPYSQKSFWTHPMKLLSDVGPMESCFGWFGYSVVSVQDRCTVCAKRTIGPEIILDHSMVLLSYKAQLEAHFGPFRDSANLDASKVLGLR
jgi:hypothetical protein